MITFQELIIRLQRFWVEKGCVLFQPYNLELGAGTFNPATFLKVLDKKPWRVCYTEPSIRPRDGRYAQNPLRVQQHWQFQVILKPAPDESQDLYLESLKRVGIDYKKHDIRFVEDDWESPTLGAWGVGWEVQLDGIEITQFTYFQQMGGIELSVIPVELTYGLERIAMFLQDTSSIFDVKWSDNLTWGDIYKRNEREFSKYNFDIADVEFIKKAFLHYERECDRFLKENLLMPAYHCVIKCSHFFNLLDSRGSIGVTERTKYILRVRKLANKVAKAYVQENP